MSEDFSSPEFLIEVMLFHPDESVRLREQDLVKVEANLTGLISAITCEEQIYYTMTGQRSRILT
jgi:hypothetical protein